MDGIGQEELVVIEGDMTGHVGAQASGYEGVHGGKAMDKGTLKERCCWSLRMR